jgi:hypothetical protein
MTPFDCDICGDFAMAEYNVDTKDMGNLELCEDCLIDAKREDNVIKYGKFAGVL